ncbi:MAG: DUF1015 domain-containing protein [Gemmatimonadota bacterium]
MQILPSARQSAPGLALAPFRGLRYAPDRVSGLAEVTSPPYDVIAHDTEGQLLAADPHNVVRLILPRPGSGPDGDSYHEAARLLHEWQDGGILLPEDQPALYVYEQSRVLRPGQPDADGAAGAGGVIQRGLIGALGLSPASEGSVLPHENVLPGPVAGRRQLMEATGANLEPIFLLYDGAGGAATGLTAQVADCREPLLAVDTGDGVRHRLWAITDPAEHAAVAADLAGRQALIADGHHRHAAYLEIQARKQAAGAGAGPWDHGLALLVDSAAYPPRIGAIHRLVPGLAAAEAATRAKAAFTVRPGPLASGSPASASAALAALAEAAQAGPAFLLAGPGESYLLTEPDPLQLAAAMPGRSPQWRALAASVLQELLLPRLLGIRDDDPAVQIHHDAAEALREAAGPPPGTAVLCPAMSAADVRDVAARGERVPRKSTSFGPKPRTGLVIRTFAQG